MKKGSDQVHEEFLPLKRKAKSLWRRSLVSIVLLVIFMGLSYGYIELMVHTQKEDAVAINVSGRQRMLSQRIALFSNQYREQLRNGSVDRELQDNLHRAIDLFERSHNALIHGSSDFNLTGEAGIVAADIYFQSPHNLDRQVQTYIALARTLVQGEAFEINMRALSRINAMSKSDLLVSLDQVVQRLEDNARQKVRNFNFLVHLGFGTSIFLVFVITIFVLRPSYRIILRYVQEQIALQKLKQETKVAAEASQAKSQFLANMSHELRTPLNGIIGLVQLINRQALDRETRDSFDLIETSSNTLLNIVNDILDLSKIEAGAVELEQLSFDAIKAAQNTVNIIKPMAIKKGLDVSFSSNQPHFWVVGDVLRFSRVITNLVSNAVRYTEEGRVDVTVNVQGSVLRCEVKDTGIGIAADNVDKIFDKFVQADSTMTRKFGGTGLGLTITKELITLMNGDIGVHSQEGEGAIFWFEVPFTPSDNVKAEGIKNGHADDSAVYESAIPAAQARFLVAEDQIMNQAFVKKLFSNFGIEHYDIVEDGVQALSHLKSNEYDVILMDCHMPNMNGYDATRAIRKLDSSVKRDIPIVAMTANAMSEDESKCLACGMNAYISKPVDVQVFCDTLAPWVRFDEE